MSVEEQKDNEGVKKFIAYVINNAADYNENPLLRSTDIGSKFLSLVPPSFLYDKKTRDHYCEACGSIFWLEKMPFFRSLETIDGELINYLKCLLNKDKLNRKDIDDLSALTTAKIPEITSTETFEKNSMNFMGLLGTYILGDLTEDTLCSVLSNYDDFVSRAPLNTLDKEKIKSKLNPSDLDPHNLLDATYLTLILSFGYLKREGNFENLNILHLTEEYQRISNAIKCTSEEVAIGNDFEVYALI